MSALDGVVITSWHATTKSGERFMDSSTHTVCPEWVESGIRYEFEVLGPPGLHPDELLTALKGAPVTKVMEPHRKIEELQETVKLERLRTSNLDGQLRKEQTEKEKLEEALKKLRLAAGARDSEDKDNKARLNALSLIGQTMDEFAFDKLAQVEMNVWLRGLQEFNMTGAEADELRAMLIRLAKEVYARAEVLRDKRRCACLLEALQRDEPTKLPKAEEGEDQLF